MIIIIKNSKNIQKLTDVILYKLLENPAIG